MVPPRSDRISRVPPYSRTNVLSTGTGLSPTMAKLSSFFPFLHIGHWPGPRSLVTTSGVSVDVLSSGYLDISVPRVSSLSGDLTVGFPHSEIHGSKLIRSSPQLIAAYHVFHRLSAPRHPLIALKALDRSHYRCPQFNFRSCSEISSSDRTIAGSLSDPAFLIGQIKKPKFTKSRSSPRGAGQARKVIFSLRWK